MKVVRVDMDQSGTKVTFAGEGQEGEGQRHAKLAALAEKRAKGKLTLEDLDVKLDTIIEILTEK